MKRGFIFPGDDVICIRDAGRDANGLPLHVPTVGNRYTITSIYAAPYGCGCTLAGMDHEPYAGYLLVAFGKRYFRKVKNDDV